jgi:hypothetical protein
MLATQSIMMRCEVCTSIGAMGDTEYTSYVCGCQRSSGPSPRFLQRD